MKKEELYTFGFKCLIIFITAWMMNICIFDFSFNNKFYVKHEFPTYSQIYLKHDLPSYGEINLKHKY